MRDLKKKFLINLSGLNPKSCEGDIEALLQTKAWHERGVPDHRSLYAEYSAAEEVEYFEGSKDIDVEG